MGAITASDLQFCTEKAKAAARHLYQVGVSLAARSATMTYTDAAAELQAASLGFTARGIGPVLDALAAYCDRQSVPDLSSLYRTKDPSAVPARWDSVADREDEARRCYRRAKWPPLTP